MKPVRTLNYSGLLANYDSGLALTSSLIRSSLRERGARAGPLTPTGLCETETSTYTLLFIDG